MATLNPKLARLSTVNEEKLLIASMPSHVSQLSKRQLMNDLRRARKLRNKYRSLAREEARARLRGGSNRRGAAVNTRVKAKAFDDALKRFEKQLAARRPVAARPKARRAPRARRSVVPGRAQARRTRTARATSMRVRSEATRALRARRKQQAMNLKRRQSFISARGRRSQARRNR
ncbi:MAG: hypothetical protein JST54_09920 [Deltaproteobacteria bacterium]|nr:hypothetical protein [Deltaproteobacteria bacterium]